MAQPATSDMRENFTDVLLQASDDRLSVIMLLQRIGIIVKNIEKMESRES
jgi:hypothetical protein